MFQPAQSGLFFDLFVSKSPAMERVYHLISRVARASYPVLITGETGTGKELVALAIHRQAGGQRPFVAVDCTALAPTLFESEMFGYVKGAFTGAIADRRGLIELAEKGTLFFDEIGNLPFELQPKLLRALQQKEIRPLGSNEIRNCASRVLAATNVPLEKGVAEGRFRADLFYRLNVMQIALPPLRARPEDIEPLVRHMVARFSLEIGVSPDISPDALLRFGKYHWPGNVRELQNVVHRAMAIEEGPTLEFLDFPPERQDLPFEGPVETLASMEKRAFLRALQITGNRQLAAKMLGVGKTTIYRKLKEYEREGRDNAE